MTGVSASSGKVKAGYTFVAIEGTRDGHDFIPEAISRGAVLIVGERAEEELIDRHEAAYQAMKSAAIPYRKVPNARRALSEIAAEVNAHPSRDMMVYGVTGTSGKTTSVYMIESILRAAGLNPGMIGTVETRYAGTARPATHTTPDAAELQEILADMRRAGCRSVVMEVSSHALDQARVADVAFDGAVFTNLSPEHLDYHADLEEYFFAKSRLFTECFDFARSSGKNPKAVICTETDWGLRLAEELGAEALRVSRADSPGVISAVDGIQGEAFGILLQSPMVGAFNISNLLGAVAIARATGISDAAISEGVRTLAGVPGRLERVGPHAGHDGAGLPRVFVDYAHKPDALEKVLRVLRDLTPVGGSLAVVFGCGGNRDRQKRPVMGEIAARLADRVVVTSDNPRSEDPNAIIQSILGGVPAPARSKVVVQADRAAAIQQAIEAANASDLVVIAGKGHETTQTTGDQVRPFDDRIVAAQALQEILDRKR